MKVKVAQSCSTLCNPMNYTVHGILQAIILKWVAFPSPGNLPNTGIEPRSPILQTDSSPAEPPRRPKNTGIGSLSPLQHISPTQELKESALQADSLPAEPQRKPIKSKTLIPLQCHLYNSKSCRKQSFIHSAVQAEELCIISLQCLAW